MRTELITNVSHDLKTPLTSMISYIDLLKNKNLPEEERLRYITILESG
ncbi:histidine kinase dimerization/phospho-acceptor domain-containing protein, partial [Streptococcus gordonii]|nr:two-component sensor histidine kinase [Streptococcus gordonii]